MVLPEQVEYQLHAWVTVSAAMLGRVVLLVLRILGGCYPSGSFTITRTRHESPSRAACCFQLDQSVPWRDA